MLKAKNHKNHKNHKNKNKNKKTHFLFLKPLFFSTPAFTD